MRLYTLPKHSSIDTSPHSLPNKTKKNSPTTSPSSITNPATNTLPIENAHPPRHPFHPLQNLLQLPLLLPRQRSGELNIIPDHKVASPTPLLRHPQVGVRIVAARLRGPAFVDDEVLAVDGGDGAFPARQGFFEVQFEGEDDVIAFAGEEGVFFLGEKLAICRRCITTRGMKKRTNSPPQQ